MSKLTEKAPAMSSIELVDLINMVRAQEGKKVELRHDHFIAKFERHPGIDAPKFRGVYVGGNGQERPCYYLPKRECDLMVMSESLQVQARIYDRLAAIEEAVQGRKQVRSDSKSANRTMNGMVEMTREEIGKSCSSHHYSNEALMINEILFGIRKSVDRDLLSAEDLEKLTKMEMRNTLLIAKGREYAERKNLLKDYHARLLLAAPPKAKRLIGKSNHTAQALNEIHGGM